MRFTVDFDAFTDEARRWFEALPEQLGTVKTFRANEFLNAYVDRLAYGHVAALRSEPVARPAQWNWMLRKLERAQLAELDPWGRLARLLPPEESADAVKALALAEMPDLAPSFALLDAARAGYPEFLRGARDGASILLTPATLPVWQRYFDNADFVYAANNRVAAHLVERFVAGRKESEGAVALLEVGGGLGSAADAVLARIGGRIAGYRFTEPFPFFLAGARRRLSRAHPGAAIEYASLDLNEPFVAQGTARASADVAIAVNVLHVVRDVGSALAELRATLRPGGALVLVECVRPAPGVPIYVDYPFQLLDEFFRVDDLGPARPHGGFLTAENWRALLAAAGFVLELELPDQRQALRWYQGSLLVSQLARVA